MYVHTFDSSYILYPTLSLAYNYLSFILYSVKSVQWFMRPILVWCQLASQEGIIYYWAMKALMSPNLCSPYKINLCILYCTCIVLWYNVDNIMSKPVFLILCCAISSCVKKKAVLATATVKLQTPPIA